MTYLNNKPMHWIQDLGRVLNATQCKSAGNQIEFDAAAEQLGAILLAASQKKSSVWWAANGGSLALCSHLSQDVLNKLHVRSFVCSDPSLLTCMANDYGYENVYSIPLQKLGEKGDVLIAISSSGNSQNIINVARVALDLEMTLVTLSGFDNNNQLFSMDKGLAFHLDSHLYGIVEVGHEAILHSVIESLWLELKDTQS